MIIWFKHVVLKGSATKYVTCENCRSNYQYHMSRKVVLDVPLILPGMNAYGQKTAKVQLEKQLKIGVEPVACPACGWMQANMSL